MEQDPFWAGAGASQSKFHADGTLERVVGAAGPQHPALEEFFEYVHSGNPAEAGGPSFFWRLVGNGVSGPFRGPPGSLLKVSVANGAEPVDFPTMVALRLPESGHFVFENLWAVLASCELKLDPGTGAPELDDDALNVTLKEQWSEADEYNAGWPSDASVFGEEDGRSYKHSKIVALHDRRYRELLEIAGGARAQLGQRLKTFDAEWAGLEAENPKFCCHGTQGLAGLKVTCKRRKVPAHLLE